MCRFYRGMCQGFASEVGDWLARDTGESNRENIHLDGFSFESRPSQALSPSREF